MQLVIIDRKTIKSINKIYFHYSASQNIASTIYFYLIKGKIIYRLDINKVRSVDSDNNICLSNDIKKTFFIILSNIFFLFYELMLVNDYETWVFLAVKKYNLVSLQL